MKMYFKNQQYQSRQRKSIQYKSYIYFENRDTNRYSFLVDDNVFNIEYLTFKESDYNCCFRITDTTYKKYTPILRLTSQKQLTKIIWKWVDED